MNVKTEPFQVTRVPAGDGWIDLHRAGDGSLWVKTTGYVKVKPESLRNALSMLEKDVVSHADYVMRVQERDAALELLREIAPTIGRDDLFERVEALTAALEGSDRRPFATRPLPEQRKRRARMVAVAAAPVIAFLSPFVAATIFGWWD